MHVCKLNNASYKPMFLEHIINFKDLEYFKIFSYDKKCHISYILILTYFYILCRILNS